MTPYTQALVNAARHVIVEWDREWENGPVSSPVDTYHPIEKLREALKGYDRAHAGKAWYMAVVGPSGSVFIKALDFFHSQGGFREPWGETWVPVIGHSVEDARRRACETLPNARPYEQQAH